MLYSEKMKATDKGGCRPSFKKRKEYQTWTGSKRTSASAACGCRCKNGEIDLAETSRMVDAFLDAGFNYFDTAHGYLQGKS